MKKKCLEALLFGDIIALQGFTLVVLFGFFPLDLVSSLGCGWLL